MQGNVLKQMEKIGDSSFVRKRYNKETGKKKDADKIKMETKLVFIFHTMLTCDAGSYVYPLGRT